MTYEPLTAPPKVDRFVAVPLASLHYLLAEDAADHRTPADPAIDGWIALMDAIGPAAMSETVNRLSNGQYQASLIESINALIALANAAEE